MNKWCCNLTRLSSEDYSSADDMQEKALRPNHMEVTKTQDSMIGYVKTQSDISLN